jgi:murein DD-endopeptidase MepM/ murein hydrolase activator NlpD
MKKVKYYYNTNSLRYEKLVTPLRVKLLRIFGFIAAALVTSLIIVSIAFRYIEPPSVKSKQNEYDQLYRRYDELNSRIKAMQQQMAELEKRDNNVYRSIFEANPIPDSARAKQIAQKEELRFVQSMNENELTQSISQQLLTLSSRMTVQNKSYNDLEQLVKNKEDFLRHIPAIQPISNKELTRIASGFGTRIDPVYKTIKFHKGLDFTAPQGTPVYATADGVVGTAGYSAGGYGNHVIINHGNGYETLYGHMVRLKVANGKQVKRGEVIGWVGSTGKSTGPHCHYEVHKNGQAVDPIYFFYNDLTPEQYDRLLKIAASGNQSFD